MRKIEKTKMVNSYIDEATIVNKYLYFKATNNENDIYYIIKVDSIDHNLYSVKYHTSQCHYFCVPKDVRKKCYTYDNLKVLNIDYRNITLYEMTFDEYIDTFRAFIKFEGKHPNELPSKIIQDYTNVRYPIDNFCLDYPLSK